MEPGMFFWWSTLKLKGDTDLGAGELSGTICKGRVESGYSGRDPKKGGRRGEGGRHPGYFNSCPSGGPDILTPASAACIYPSNS
jgi:hypothetical protein